ncbi:hypothetical protein GOP47_0029282 [Adiantum capillus-veneris]|nr:hypothetical protein GOP47_0029282 [Adiantum capillus-veneris]
MAAAGEQEVTGHEVCVEKLCFQQPFSTAPPPFYPRLPHKIQNWKVQAMLTTESTSELTIGRDCVLPHCFGLGDYGRWRWRWIPISMLFGLKGCLLRQKKDMESLSACRSLSPYMRLKSLTPFLGRLALQPVLEVSTVPSAEIRRRFSVGQAKLAIRASIKASTNGLRWAIQLNWKSTERDLLRSKLENDVMTFEYLWRWAISKSLIAVASAAVRMPSLDFQRFFSGDMNFGSVKVTHRLGSRVLREKPLATLAYTKASEKFRESGTITVAPGHYIDPGNESGAPGEREFNLEIANLVERDLHAHGWRVLRPDRDAPYLSWEEYLNWVSKQTLRGHPVVEIHGQGPTADFRGHVIGVIGDPNTLLNKELAKTFGFYDMDWRELGVPRRGGVIVESFDSDEILQMAPLQRAHAARSIATQLVESIQRASLRSQTKDIGCSYASEIPMRSMDEMHLSMEKCVPTSTSSSTIDSGTSTLRRARKSVLFRKVENLHRNIKETMLYRSGTKQAAVLSLAVLEFSHGSPSIISG